MKDISLHISKGKKIAIVGPSGAGKSTLLYLLLHFWDIDGGNILIDGRDLNYYRGDDLRKSYSALLQNSSLFAGSLRSNLILSEPDATDEKMWEALRKAYIEEFFKKEAQGLDTWIGEHGLDLSAGQRQRVMLARFFLRDSNMLLLDEPTIHLDPVLERRIMQSILEHAKDRSLLLITQRIVGLEAMDEIIVLDEGKIVERGGMDKLLTKEGLFKKMISIQEQIIK